MTTPAPSENELEEDVPPSPAALIESLRSFGYSPATAIADLIDNSVTAGASDVTVTFEWSGPNSSVLVADDGRGMSEDELRSAMKAGSLSPLAQRSHKDLGRFGLGLKTASFSQARSLTVASRSTEHSLISVRRWDLDHVGRADRWSLLKSYPEDSKDHLEAILNARQSGTVVLWNSLDRIVDDRPASDAKARATFYQLVDQVRSHLEMVFHRFIEEDGLVITVNGQLCKAWDPFLIKHAKTEVLPDESLAISRPNGDIEPLVIQPYVLPHVSNLLAEEHKHAAGPRGWNLQQGFYLYRARRLIVPGDWFDPNLKPEEHYKLARIRVEITQAMDADWNLDVRKARAHPPAALREDFRRIARATRDKASEVYRHRGRSSVGQSPRKPLVPMWIASNEGESLTIRINRNHAVIQAILDDAAGAKLKDLKVALSILENTVPVAFILSYGFEDESKLNAGGDAPVHETVQGATLVFQRLVKTGMTVDEAKETLRRIQPFDRHPGIVEALEAQV